MFYCQKCAKLKSWPFERGGLGSHGPCELCGNVGFCMDIQSKYLPAEQGADLPVLRRNATLGDYFAGKAMQGILTSDQFKPIVIEKAVNEDKRIFGVISAAAYDLAEEMLEERRRRQKN